MTAALVRFNTRTFSSFRSRNYRLFFAGQRVSQIGSWMQRIALGWFVFQLTHSAFAVGVMALATFGVRIFVPETVSVLNMHPGDFPQYVLMFAAGIAAHRGGWFERLPQRIASRWALATLLLSLPLLAVLIVAGGALEHGTAQYDGGFNLVSAGKCLWESLVCVGMSFAFLALYRRYFDRQGRWAKFLSDNAFAVYLFHPPVIIALALLLHAFVAPALVKAAVEGLLPRGIGIERLRDPPAEWARQFEALGLNPQ